MQLYQITNEAEQRSRVGDLLDKQAIDGYQPPVLARNNYVTSAVLQLLVDLDGNE